jgi:hypothetical protein
VRGVCCGDMRDAPMGRKSRHRLNPCRRCKTQSPTALLSCLCEEASVAGIWMCGCGCVGVDVWVWVCGCQTMLKETKTRRCRCLTPTNGSMEVNTRGVRTE